MTENETKFLSTKEVAKMLGCSDVTVQRYVKRGDFPGARKFNPRRKNSRFLIPEQSVLDFINDQLIVSETAE